MTKHGYMAQADGKYIGHFKTEDDAAMAYNDAISYRKEFAVYNISKYN